MEQERRQEFVEQGRQLKEALAAAEAEVTAVQDRLQREGQRLPNLAHPDVSRLHLLRCLWLALLRRASCCAGDR